MTDILTKSQRSRQMALVRDRDTTPELVVRKLCHSLGYRYRLHVRSLPGCPDLVFPRLRKVLFVHGCFWHKHNCKRGKRMPKSSVDYWQSKLAGNQTRDRKHRARLRRLGWQVSVVWECQTKPSRIEQLRETLAEYLAD